MFRCFELENLTRNVCTYRGLIGASPWIHIVNMRVHGNTLVVKCLLVPTLLFRIRENILPWGMELPVSFVDKTRNFMEWNEGVRVSHRCALPTWSKDKTVCSEKEHSHLWCGGNRERCDVHDVWRLGSKDGRGRSGGQRRNGA